MNHLWAIFIVGLCASAVLAERVNYNGHRVIEVVPKSRESLRLLEKLESSGVIKFWVEPTTLNRPTSFQVSPGHYKLINRMLKRDGLSPTVLIDNIQKLIEKQDKEILARQKIHHADGKAFDFENYHRYSELLDFMQETAANNSLVSYSVIGSSYEGRDIGQVTLRVGNDPNKEAILLECGIHAREWVSPAACIWIFDQLANGYGTDPDVTRLLDLYDWIIIPSTNPDGYEYCWTDDRLWRKNRRPSSGFPNCPGVDLNRNYDANFGGDGSSAVPCSETYHGASAFSESESIAVRDSLEAHRGFIKAYVSIHSYGGLWMSPYGYRPDVPVEYDEMYRVMAIGVAAIEATYNKDFTFGDEASILWVLMALPLLVFFLVDLVASIGQIFTVKISLTQLSPAEIEIKNVRDQTYRLAVKENFECESLLLSIPIGIATMVDLIVMASTLEDFSLDAQKPAGGFQFIKYPKSFHASLQQVNSAAYAAFLKAHVNMDKILPLVGNMPDYVESIQTIFESKEEVAIEHIIPQNLESIKEAVAQCSQLSKEVVDGFNKVMELTEEVNLATTALKGNKVKLNTKAEKDLELLKLKKKETEKILRELEESKTKIKAEATDAYERTSKAMDEMTGAFKTVAVGAADTILNMITLNTMYSNLVEQIHSMASSKLQAAQDELYKVRKEVKQARLQRKKEQEKQMKILIEMGKHSIDTNDYETAIGYLTRGLGNLTKVHHNWARLQAFFGKVESFININVVKNVEDLKKWLQMVLSEKMKITSLPIEKKIRITTDNASRYSEMVSHIAGIYNKVSAKYIMKSLTEWNRITNSAGKSKGSIEADRQKVRELCIEAESGIKQLLESEEKKNF